MSNRWKIAYVLLSLSMMLMAVFSCQGGEVAKTVLFVGIAIWVLLVKEDVQCD